MALTPHRRFNAVTLVALAAGVLVCLPIATIVTLGLVGQSDVWGHLVDTLLAQYLMNSLGLVIGVAAGVLLLGVPSAALVSLTDFPGRRALSLVLLLPLAFPAYILAYTYTGLLDAAGPVARWVDPRTLDSIRSLPGAALMLSLVLYPYVYLLARASFLSRSASTLEVGRTLGLTPLQATIKLALPMARPAIVAGLTLALMETLADYGTVAFFGVPTFTTGIMRAYYGLGDAVAAAQLALTLLAFVALLVLLEKYSRRKLRYFSGASQRSHSRVRLHGWRAGLAMSVCALPPLLGFAVPGCALLWWGLVDARDQWWDLGPMAASSFGLASMAALLLVMSALALGYAERTAPSRLTRGLTQIAGLGYALPGTIIAVGVLIPLAKADQWLFVMFRDYVGVNVGLLFTGSVAAVLVAYGARFTAVSLGAITSGLGRIKPSLDEAAMLLGHRPLQIVRRVHVPLMRGAVLTSALVVFVDVLKELPATLILRPFDFNTLAVRAYELASDERLLDAAPASLMIVAVGLIPVIYLNRSVSEAKY